MEGDILVVCKNSQPGWLDFIAGMTRGVILIMYLCKHPFSQMGTSLNFDKLASPEVFNEGALFKCITRYYVMSTVMVVLC